ncbi:hypothetical protein [Nocardia sp. NPDC005745]|uniref:hypothetical protein n=1 Tax=Nocardia sp. NPDC005745 TaxID=3157061 RepID=UPI0033D77A64
MTERVDRSRMIELMDAVVGPIKQRARGHTAGELLVGMAAAQGGKSSWSGGTTPLGSSSLQ